MPLARKDEARAVKRELAKYGIEASVTHGTGTSRSWLYIHTKKYPANLKDFQKRDKFVTKIAQQVTGRKGDYDGRISFNG